VPLLDVCAKQNPDKALAITNAKTFFMLNSPRILPKWLLRALDAKQTGGDSYSSFEIANSEGK
jgi:hypothetical protein